MNVAIPFTKLELKAYPMIQKIEVGMRGVANDNCDYKGLIGTVSELRYGQQKETENDCILEVVMDFEEPLHGSLEDLYPVLNGTGIGGVVLDEESVGIFFEDNVAQTLDGKIVCPTCHLLLDYVSEVQEDDIHWNLENGVWMKTNGEGSSNGKRCPYCDARIDDDNAILDY